MQRLSILNNSKLSVTEKTWSKTKYLTWNCITLEFGKKKSMLNPVTRLIYIKCYNSHSPRPIKSSCNFIRKNCQKIRSLPRKNETILEIRKKTTFLDNKPITYKFLKYFTNNRKKTNSTVFFSCRPLPYILSGYTAFILKYTFYHWRIRRFHQKIICTSWWNCPLKTVTSGWTFFPPTFHKNFKRNQLKC